MNTFIFFDMDRYREMVRREIAAKAGMDLPEKEQQTQVVSVANSPPKKDRFSQLVLNFFERISL